MHDGIQLKKILLGFQAEVVVEQRPFRKMEPFLIIRFFVNLEKTEPGVEKHQLAEEARMRAWTDQPSSGL